MPRKPRLHAPGGLYHVILRGNNCQPLFFSVADRDRWMDLLGEGLDRYRCRIHAYCWMTNHVHMAVQVADLPLSDLIRWTATQYSRSTNKRYHRTGHLFERRHRAILVDADEYLLQLVRYIHVNPAVAHMVADPTDYPWSSHRAYLGLAPQGWLDIQWVLSFFSPKLGAARRKYAQFTAQWNDEATTASFAEGSETDSRLLGSDSFVAQAMSRDNARKMKHTTLDEIIHRFCMQFSVTEFELASASRLRHYSRVRALIASEATQHGAATLAEIAARFNRSESGIARGVRLLQAKQRHL